jgi:lipopolysaccharide exporter
VSFKLVNLQGDLFATAFSFFSQAAIRLGSSLILTRILRPEAYGIIIILTSVIFIVGMLSDLGMSVFIVRDPHGDEPKYLNTAWTIRLVRAFANGAITFACAGLIAWLYAASALVVPLRVFSLWFIIDGFESTAFPLAIRRRNSRVVMYSELLATLLSAVFGIVYCYFSRDFWGMVYAALLNRLLLVLLSHRFYRDLRPHLQYDRTAAREIFKYTRFVMPSSMLTLVLDQFDKAAFLRLFELPLLGVYGLASNIASPIEGLIGKASHMVLYPRCAHNFRANRDSFSLRYYTENIRLFAGTLAIPAVIGGAAHLIVTLLYDPRYERAGAVLQAFMVRAVLLALATPAEQMLIAAGEVRVILFGNVFRAMWLPIACLTGYYFFGFMGFTYGTALSGLPPLIYYLWLQRHKGLLIARYEIYRVMFVCAVAAAAYFASTALAPLRLAGIRFWH